MSIWIWKGDPTFGRVSVELRYEAGHEDAGLVSQEVVAPVVLVNRVGPVPSGLAGGAHVGLEVEIGLRTCRGGEVGEVGHQVVLIERPPGEKMRTDLIRGSGHLILPPMAPVSGSMTG